MLAISFRWAFEKFVVISDRDIDVDILLLVFSSISSIEIVKVSIEASKALESEVVDRDVDE